MPEPTEPGSIAGLAVDVVQFTSRLVPPETLAWKLCTRPALRVALVGAMLIDTCWFVIVAVAVAETAGLLANEAVMVAFPPEGALAGAV